MIEVICANHLIFITLVQWQEQTKIKKIIVLSFSIVQNEIHLASLDQNVFCIINCKENYEQLNAACKPVFDENDELIAEMGLFVDGKIILSSFYLGEI